MWIICLYLNPCCTVFRTLCDRVVVYTDMKKVVEFRECFFEPGSCIYPIIRKIEVLQVIWEVHIFQNRYPVVEEIEIL